ncbi:restriction endonuclease subunit R [Staphylococcus casei]|nr:restriction endonuclease subunit R [Staphylococcus casei]
MDDILHDKLKVVFNLENQYPDIPSYITDNLKHSLRPYQEEALQHLLYLNRNGNDLIRNKLMFNMATGAGKTLVMAATMLYYYKQFGYQNFLFFVHSNAIVNKTKENFGNIKSNKYLFNPEGIVIDGKKINIQIVDNYPTLPDKNTIYLKLTTINTLHDKLTYPQENEITYEDLKQIPLVLLADEAHHFNVNTKKKGKDSKNKKEIEERNWELTIDRIMSLNPKNKLLEYTATLQLEDAIYEKYKDRIIYRYDLKEFMNQGYSKNVTVLHTSEENSTKILNALIMSQYKKDIAKENSVNLKPVIMFQSTTISSSNETHQLMRDVVDELTIDKLKNTIEHGYQIYNDSQSLWKKVFKYYRENEKKLLSDLKWEFPEEATVNVNNEKEQEKKARLLNSLEDMDNPIRAIFAVFKLNEGWDVLNLYDIVKLDENKKVNIAATNSEAQLIGRGARYYPFVYKEKKSYKRRFDVDVNDLQAIETLHYHTIRNSSYIDNLQKSLTEYKIETQSDKKEVHKASLKPSFKRSNIYKYGKIFINKTIPTTSEDYNSLEDYQGERYFNKTMYSSKESYLLNEAKSTTDEYKEIEIELTKQLVQKALRSNPFYHFSNLRNYVPSITSINEFIESKAFLGDLNLTVSVPYKLDNSNLTSKFKLSVIQDYLISLESKIKNNYLKEKGTPVFEGYKISEIIGDYAIDVSNINRTAKDVNDQKSPKVMANSDWYIYDKAIANGLEKKLIALIGNWIEELKKRYEEVYLIRNERKIKYREIDGVRGFMPDFLLYLKDNKDTYQVFVEPKGPHLLSHDEWKEKFMLSLNERDDIKILAENNDVRLIGLCFYSDENSKWKEFTAQFNQMFLQ